MEDLLNSVTLVVLTASMLERVVDHQRLPGTTCRHRLDLSNQLVSLPRFPRGS
jgi:hypothetical protein